MRWVSMATELAPDLSSVDAVETRGRTRGLPLQRLWAGLWPKLAAAGLILALWQVVVWSGWKPDYVLPGPLPVFQRLAQDLGQADFYTGVAVTMRRAPAREPMRVVLGSAVRPVGAAVPRVPAAGGEAPPGPHRL